MPQPSRLPELAEAERAVLRALAETHAEFAPDVPYITRRQVQKRIERFLQSEHPNPAARPKAPTTPRIGQILETMLDTSTNRRWSKARSVRPVKFDGYVQGSLQKAQGHDKVAHFRLTVTGLQAWRTVAPQLAPLQPRPLWLHATAKRGRVEGYDRRVVAVHGMSGVPMDQMMSIARLLGWDRQRVLLVDFDLDMPSEEPGLGEFLSGTATLEDVIQRGPRHVDTLPTGRLAGALDPVLRGLLPAPSQRPCLATRGPLAALRQLDEYRIVLLRCAPGLGLQTYAATVVTADAVLMMSNVAAVRSTVSHRDAGNGGNVELFRGVRQATVQTWRWAWGALEAKVQAALADPTGQLDSDVIIWDDPKEATILLDFILGDPKLLDALRRDGQDMLSLVLLCRLIVLGHRREDAHRLLTSLEATLTHPRDPHAEAQHRERCLGQWSSQWPDPPPDDTAVDTDSRRARNA